jgi:FMN hydrolase / 5-amino-6-(5-phospho-D-ribitylamino)uracil phosphatase
MSDSPFNPHISSPDNTLSMNPRLICLDIGGTLGSIEGQSIATKLSTKSTLSAHAIQEALRKTLYIAPFVTETVIEQVCEALQISTALFPRNDTPPRLSIYPETLDALRCLAKFANLVTLSNVCSPDLAGAGLPEQIAAYVAEQYPSCKLGYAKPDENAFIEVARRWGLQPKHLLHIGDDWECDIMGALNAGATALWISHGRSIPWSNPLNSPHLAVAKDLAVACQIVAKSTIKNGHCRFDVETEPRG